MSQVTKMCSIMNAAMVYNSANFRRKVPKAAPKPPGGGPKKLADMALKSPSGGFSSYVSIKELSLTRGKDKLGLF